MPTYRRFSCVERSITLFLNQTKSDLFEKELIILNTDIEYPLELDSSFNEEDRKMIIIINNNIDYITGKEYTNTGAIRRDAFSHSSGNYYVTWDDDDIFLPWNLIQCYDGIKRCGKSAWKPYSSLSWLNNYDSKIEKSVNFMEASVIVKSDKVEFNLESGPEGLLWYYNLDKAGDFTNSRIEEDKSIAGYCFNWADPYDIGGQKQSGSPGESCFEEHKKQTKDFASTKLTKKSLLDYKNILYSCYSAIQTNYLDHSDIIKKYIG